MATFKARPLPVEAMQWTGTNWTAIKEWFGQQKTDDTYRLDPPQGHGFLLLDGPFISARIEKSDWVICNHIGSVFFANDATFQERYVLTEEALSADGGTHERPLS